MSDHAPARAASADVLNRRAFLNRLSLILSGLIGLVLSVPILAYLLTPLIRQAPGVWLDVGSVDQFQIGETLLAEGKPELAAKELLSVEYVYAYPKWSARALLEAGKAFEQLKQMDQAKQQYAKVVEKYKDLPEAGLAQDRLKVIKGS